MSNQEDTNHNEKEEFTQPVLDSRQVPETNVVPDDSGNNMMQAGDANIPETFTIIPQDNSDQQVMTIVVSDNAPLLLGQENDTINNPDQNEASQEQLPVLDAIQDTQIHHVITRVQEVNITNEIDDDEERQNENNMVLETENVVQASGDLQHTPTIVLDGDTSIRTDRTIEEIDRRVEITMDQGQMLNQEHIDGTTATVMHESTPNEMINAEDPAVIDEYAVDTLMQEPGFNMQDVDIMTFGQNASQIPINEVNSTISTNIGSIDMMSSTTGLSTAQIVSETNTEQQNELQLLRDIFEPVIMADDTGKFEQGLHQNNSDDSDDEYDLLTFVKPAKNTKPPVKKLGQVGTLAYTKTDQGIVYTKEPDTSPLSMFVKPTELSDHNSDSDSSNSSESLADKPSLKRGMFIKTDKPQPSVEEIWSSDQKDNFNEAIIHAAERYFSEVQSTTKKVHNKTDPTLSALLDFTRNNLQEYIEARDRMIKTLEFNAALKERLSTARKKVGRKKMQQDADIYFKTAQDHSGYIKNTLDKHHAKSNVFKHEDYEYLENMITELVSNKCLNDEYPLQEVLVNLEEICKLRKKMSARFRPDIKKHMIMHLVNLVKSPAEFINIYGNEYKNDYISGVVDLLARTHIPEIGVTDVANVWRQRVELDYTGKITIQDDKIIMMTSKGTHVDQITLSASQKTAHLTTVAPDAFVKKILEQTKIVVVDYDNAIRAMHLTQQQVTAFCKYLESWGITTIMVTMAGAEREVPGITSTVAIPQQCHDDTEMLLISAIHGAAIMTKDEHAEFLDIYTVCLKHRTIQYRKNEVCPHGINMPCDQTLIRKRPVGKLIVRDVVIENGKVKSLVSTKYVVEKGKIPADKQIKTKYRVTHHDTKRLTQDVYWNVLTPLETGPMPALSYAYASTQVTVTVLQCSTTNAASVIYAPSMALALVEAMTNIGSTGIKALKQNIDIVLEMNEGRLRVRETKTNQIVGKNIPIPLSVDVDNRYLSVVSSRLFNILMQPSALNNLTLLQEDLYISTYLINLDKARMYVNQIMLDEGVLIIEQEEKCYMLKAEDRIINAIQKSAVEYLKNNADAMETALYVFPFTTATKRTIASYYHTEASPYPLDRTHDGSLKKGDWSSSLQRYFSDVDADRPSKFLIAPPTNAMVLLGTLGLELTDPGQHIDVLETVNCSAKIEYLSGGIATYLMQQQPDDTLIHVEMALDGTDTGTGRIVSKGLSIKDQNILHSMMISPVNKVLLDIAHDMLNTFKALYQGRPDVFLPPLVRASHIKTLKLKKETRPLYVEMDWSVPIGSVKVKMWVSYYNELTLAAFMVSVSPSITHNYIATMLGSDMVLTCEYSDIMVQKFEEESAEEIWPFLEDKMDYIGVYYTMYGSYSVGLKMLGIDPITILLKSSHLVEQGIAESLTKEKTPELKSFARQGNFRETIKSIIDTNGTVYAKPTMKDNKWMKHVDVHMITDTLVLMLRNRDKDNFIVVFTLGSMYMGATCLLRHLVQCHSVKVTSMRVINPLDVWKMLNGSSAPKYKWNVKCQNPEVIEPPSITTQMIQTTNADSLKFQQGDMIKTMDVYRPTRMSRYYIDKVPYAVQNMIPSYGNIMYIDIISVRTKSNIRTRNRFLYTNLEESENIAIEKKIVKINNINEVYGHLKPLIAEAHDKRQNIVLNAFDAFGSLYKALKQEDKLTVYIPVTMVVYIPDNLLFNAMKYDLQQKDKADDELYNPIQLAMETSDQNDDYQSKTTTPRVTKHLRQNDAMFYVKVAIVVLVLVVATYFYPITNFFLTLPLVMFTWAFPAKHTMIKPSWFMSLFGAKAKVMYLPVSKLHSFFSWSITAVWWFMVVAAVVWALLKLFKE